MKTADEVVELTKELPERLQEEVRDFARFLVEKRARPTRKKLRLDWAGGLKDLRRWPPHAIEHLFFYAVTPEAEPRDISPVLIDVSAPEIVAVWTAAMAAHQSQTATRNYVELQLTRARVFGARAGIGHAIALFPNDPLVFDSLAPLNQGARRF